MVFEAYMSTQFLCFSSLQLCALYITVNTGLLKTIESNTLC